MPTVKTSTTSDKQAQKPIEVLIVDDVDILRIGLRLTLDSSPFFKVVGECAEGESAVAMTRRLNPDIVLMDVGMSATDGIPKMGGIEATAQIKEHVPKSHVIMFTSHNDDDEILAALGAGADGYCLKDLSSTELQEAMRAVANGQRWIDPRITQQFRNFVRQSRRILRDRSRPLQFSPHKMDKQALSAQRILASMPAVLRTEGAFAGRYQIEEVIGHGGTGVVYRAIHTFLERTVAIKVLDAEASADLKVIAQFKKESQALSSVKHRNVISVYDFGVTETGQPFLVMDYVNGPSLDTFFEQKETVDMRRYIDIFVQVCDGLSATHALSLIHCDLKPNNIMLEKDRAGRDQVKIVDFGLAKVIPKTTSVQTKVTDSFEITGSPLYMSPEQCSGSTLDARSDIYSLGCIMYEAFTGKPVFDGTSPYKIFSQHLTETPQPFSSAQPERHIPEEIESIVFRALKKEPSERYQTPLLLKHHLIQSKIRLCHQL